MAPSKLAKTINVLPSGRVIRQICAQLPMEHKFMRSPKIGQSALRSRLGAFEMAAAVGLTIAGFFAVFGNPAAPVLARAGCGVG